MSKLLTAMIVSLVFLQAYEARLLSAQACAISTKPENRYGYKGIFGCASPGAACSPAVNGGGPGKCQTGAVLDSATNSLCGCFPQGKSTTADPTVDIQALVTRLSRAKPGDVFNFEFTADDLSQQQTFLFLPNLFDANPRVLSTRLTVTVKSIDQGKRVKEENGIEENQTGGFENERHGRGSAILNLLIAGNEVYDSFNVNGFGSTGVNTQTFVAGEVALDLKTLLFDGLVTSILTNVIWTAKNPMTLAEAWGGSLDPKTNTVTFETTAPGNAFIVPAASLSLASSAPAGRLFPPKPAVKDFTEAEKAKMEWFEKVRRTH
jgi:hypothetical protein